MRSLLPCFMLLAACSQGQEPASSIATGTFAGEGRSRLCIAGEAGNYRAGLIAYGKGDANCSASGRIEVQGNQLTLIPRGEGSCQIPLIVEGDTVRLGDMPASCSYYCGPEAAMAGRSFKRADTGAGAVDLGGDPLC